MLLCGLGGLLARLGSCAAAAVVAALTAREMARLRGHDAQVTNESAASGHVTAVLTCDWLQDLVNTAAMAAQPPPRGRGPGHPLAGRPLPQPRPAHQVR